MNELLPENMQHQAAELREAASKLQRKSVHGWNTGSEIVDNSPSTVYWRGHWWTRRQLSRRFDIPVGTIRCWAARGVLIENLEKRSLPIGWSFV